MKEAKLEVRKPSQRLIDLVNAIPELELEGDKVIYKYSVMYDATRGCIQWEINKARIECNPLKTAYKLNEACNRKIASVTEESFCDLLNEHLYITAKDKLEELLPQIQEHYPRATIITGRHDKNIYIMADIECPTSDTIAIAYSDCDWEVRAGLGSRSLDIWEDEANLIVKTSKQWWETQTTHYTVTLRLDKDRFEPAKCLFGITPTSYNTVGITRFKNEDDAQTMCDKLNKVLKGE